MCACTVQRVCKQVLSDNNGAMDNESAGTGITDVSWVLCHAWPEAIRVLQASMLDWAVTKVPQTGPCAPTQVQVLTRQVAGKTCG